MIFFSWFFSNFAELKNLFLIAEKLLKNWFAIDLIHLF